MQRNTSAAKVLFWGKICLGVLSAFIGSQLLIACGGPESDDEDEGGGGLVVQHDDGFIDIPAGKFTLSHKTGSHSSGATVTLKAFALKKTPVTVAEFEKCVEAGACKSEHYYDYRAEDHDHGAYTDQCNYNRGADWKNHPMNCIDWAGAKEYCKWIGGRLPTEEEWEYASTHNGTEHLNTTYTWGNDPPQHCVTAQYYDSSTEKYCQGNVAAPMSNKANNPGDAEGTSDVSLHSPAGDSPLGLVDMTGNVFEWTSSLYANSSEADPVMKGGCFENEDGEFLSVTFRGAADPANLSETVGFRCAK